MKLSHLNLMKEAQTEEMNIQNNPDLKAESRENNPPGLIVKNVLKFFTLLLLTSSICCNQPSSIPEDYDDLTTLESKNSAIKGALLATRFKSIEELKAVIQIEYFNVNPSQGCFNHKKPTVRLTHRSYGLEVISVLESGVSDLDFKRARDGSFWKRVQLGFDSPYFVSNRKDLLRVYTLARRSFKIFGERDVAFYDLAESMLYNINDDDMAFIYSKEFSEKGYINTFNHINAQVFMTVLFSEKLADFIADTHELGNMPELITGKFTEDQLTDLENGPIDNYTDMINNEYGQELGKVLKKRYKISRETNWTPELLSNYLNDIQSYYSWAFQIGFKPFTAEDERLKRFSNKINRVMGDLSELR